MFYKGVVYCTNLVSVLVMKEANGVLRAVMGGGEKAKRISNYKIIGRRFFFFFLRSMYHLLRYLYLQILGMSLNQVYRLWTHIRSESRPSQS